MSAHRSNNGDIAAKLGLIVLALILTLAWCTRDADRTETQPMETSE